MNTKLSRIKTAARGLLLLIVLGYSLKGVSQIDFEVREEAPVGPGNLQVIRTHPNDWDRDGDLDLLITGTRRDGIHYRITELYLNQGDTQFTLVSSALQNCHSAAIADVDGDQDLDVLQYGKCLGDTNTCTLYLNDGIGNFTPVNEDQFPEISTPSIAKFFHYDDDGQPDVFLAGMGSESMITGVYRNLGNGRFEEVPEVVIQPKLRPSAVEIGDIDNDGDNDIILTGVLHGDYHGTFIHLNNGGIFSEPIMITELAQGTSKLHDFNNDGFLDLLVSGDDLFGDYAASYFLNDGNGNFIFAPEQVFLPSTDPTIEVNDFDGDGDSDVFIGGRDGVHHMTGIPDRNGNVLYLNDGSGTFARKNELRNSGTGGSAIGNFDGKGLPDIMLYGNMDYNQGPIKHMVYLNRTVVDEIPVASEVIISGELLVGKQLNGSYDFLDPEGANDVSSLRWYRALDNLGTEKTLIAEATSDVYYPDESDIQKFISFEVIPNDGTQIGESVQSEWVGPILMPVPKIMVKGNNSIIEEEASASLENHTHFGSVSTSNEVERTFTIENTGTAALTITSISSSGTNAADFIPFFQEGFTLIPGDSKAFNVNFSPSGTGIRTAEINVESNDVESSPFIFKISGEGLNTAPVFSSSSEVNYEENSSEIVIDINASDGDVGIEDLGVSYTITGGEDMDLFSIDQENGHLRFNASPDFEVPLDHNEDNVYLVSITADDGEDLNSSTTQSLFISVTNSDEPPTAVCVANLTVILNANGTASLTADDINNLSTDDIGIANLVITPSHFSCTDVGTKIVILTVTDTGGNKTSCTTMVNVVNNYEPVVTGTAKIFGFSGPEGCGAYVNVVLPTIIDNCHGTVLEGVREDGLDLAALYPVGDTEIVWTATSVNNVVSEPFTQIVSIANNAPENITVIGPDGPREIGSPILMRCSFTDENIASATWKAFNGNQVVQEHSTAATGSESFFTFENLSAGVYTIILELNDQCGRSATAYSDYVVLYDPNGGFVTGGGWFESPPGALRGSEAFGKAHFGFNAKYKDGKSDVAGEVDGNTSFQFKTGNLDFKSSSHEKMSLVVSGGFKATYKGQGTINGNGDYQFMVTIIDAEETTNYSVDLFRIKIWNDQGVLYDNMLEAEENADPTTMIGGGSIVIHKPRMGTSKSVVTLENKNLMEEVEVFTAYPNPMNESTTISFQVNRTSGAILNLFDLNGREISRLFEGEVQQGIKYNIKVTHQNLMKGVYLYRLVLASGEVFQKQLLVN